MLESEYKRMLIYTYAMPSDMTSKDRVIFFYAIKGRNGKPGLLKDLGVQQLGRCVLLAPVEVEKQFDEFLQKWRFSFTKRQVLVGS